MPANIESMFSVRQMPWHREGTIVQDYPGSWNEARTLAGLDWDPVTAPVYAVTGINPDGTEHLRAHRGLEDHHPLRHRSRPVPEQGHLHRHRPRRDGRDRRSGPGPAQRQMGNRGRAGQRQGRVVPGPAR